MTRIAVVGRQRSGKSTLVNLLLGREILPVDVVTCTAVPIFVSFGEVATVRVTFQNGRVQLHDDQIEECLARCAAVGESPRSCGGVRHCELLLPEPILKHLTLVDLPGYDSLDGAHEKMLAATLKRVEAALFVCSLGADIGAAELNWIEIARQRCDRVLGVLVNIDHRCPSQVLVAHRERTRMLVGKNTDGNTTPVGYLDFKEATRLGAISLLLGGLGRFFAADAPPVDFRDSADSIVALNEEHRQAIVLWNCLDLGVAMCLADGQCHKGEINILASTLRRRFNKLKIYKKDLAKVIRVRAKAPIDYRTIVSSFRRVATRRERAFLKHTLREVAAAVGGVVESERTLLRDIGKML